MSPLCLSMNQILYFGPLNGFGFQPTGPTIDSLIQGIQPGAARTNLIAPFVIFLLKFLKTLVPIQLTSIKGTWHWRAFGRGLPTDGLKFWGAKPKFPMRSFSKWWNQQTLPLRRWLRFMVRNLHSAYPQVRSSFLAWTHVPIQKRMGQPQIRLQLISLLLLEQISFPMSSNFWSMPNLFGQFARHGVGENRVYVEGFHG